MYLCVKLLFHFITVIIFFFTFVGCAHQKQLNNVKNFEYQNKHLDDVKSYEYQIDELGMKSSEIIVSGNEKECWIEIKGYSNVNMERAFWLAAQDADRRICTEKWVILNFGGGYIKPITVIGNRIRSREYNTTFRKIGGICNSSCAFLFIAGVKREIPIGKTDAKIGFSRPSKQGPNGEKICMDFGNIETSFYYQYATNMLQYYAGTTFFNVWMSPECGKVRYMRPEELLKSGIATGVGGPHSYNEMKD